jgi:hypothetical protein
MLIKLEVQMNNASPCSHCNERDHIARKCPALRDVLNDGFYSGGNGGGGHDHDEEDSTPSVRILYVSSYPRPFSYADQGKNEHNVQFRR